MAEYTAFCLLLQAIKTRFHTYRVRIPCVPACAAESLSIQLSLLCFFWVRTMAKWLSLHPQNPQARLLAEVAAGLLGGQIMAYPTQTHYALGCLLHQRQAIDRLYKLRSLSVEHPFALVCRDIAQIASFATVDNQMFRLIKAHIGEPITYVLPITKRVSRRLDWPRKRHEMGFQLMQTPLVRGLLSRLPEPLVTTTLPPIDDQTLNEGYLIDEALGGQLDMLLDIGEVSAGETTVVDLTSDVPQVLRAGVGIWRG